MKEEKVILLGCDDTKTVAIVMNSIGESEYYAYNIITVTKSSDLINLTKSVTPDLVIPCFRDNQLVVNDLSSFAKSPAFPILCISKETAYEKLYWPKNSIVFVYLLEHINRAGYLNSIINSIFLLKNDPLAKNKSTSLAEAAIKDNQLRSDRDMSKVVLELDQKVDVLLKVKERIAGLFSQVEDPIRVELTHIVNSIKKSVNDTKLWEDFKLYFVKTNPDFLFLLVKKYPSLTQIDLKYCCYLKMNMSNDDIKSLLGINQESVRTHKYRLKKKMVLGRDQSLRSYLQSFN